VCLAGSPSAAKSMTARSVRKTKVECGLSDGAESSTRVSGRRRVVEPAWPRVTGVLSGTRLGSCVKFHLESAKLT
jgi:hypothetical protein